MLININLKNFEIKLSKINQSLWDIEDQLRKKEKEKSLIKNSFLLPEWFIIKTMKEPKLKG